MKSGNRDVPEKTNTTLTHFRKSNSLVLSIQVDPYSGRFHHMELSDESRIEKVVCYKHPAKYRDLMSSLSLKKK